MLHMFDTTELASNTHLHLHHCQLLRANMYCITSLILDGYDLSLCKERPCPLTVAHLTLPQGNSTCPATIGLIIVAIC